MTAKIYTPNTVSLAGLDLAAIEAALESPAGTSGDSFANTGKEVFYIKNTGSQMTVTFNSVTACNRQMDHDIVVTVAATTGKEMIGPFKVERFGSSVSVDFSSTSGVSVTVLKIPE